jgi:hypothetical protein
LHLKAECGDGQAMKSLAFVYSHIMQSATDSGELDTAMKAAENCKYWTDKAREAGMT